MSRNRKEAINAGVDVCETKHSMKRRSSCHNYYAKGLYMLTLVVERRSPLLGRLQGDGFAAIGSGEEARIELSSLGRAIRDVEIKKIPAYYPMVEVWKLCIMPDHIHMIVRVKEDMPEGKHLGQVVRGFKTGCTRAWWERTMPEGKTSGTRTTKQKSEGTEAAKQKAEGIETAKQKAERTETAKQKAERTEAAIVPDVSPSGKSDNLQRPVLFEQGYCDKILMREGQLDNWKRYLDDNPRRLAIKRQCPEFFTVMDHVNLWEWNCQIVGNRYLLSYPEKAAVIVHHGYSDKEFNELKEKWLALGENGGVLISAAIATREKEVMREAMNRGYRLIVLRENGFPPLYKPAGESFEACSNGDLLLISPWEYHMNRRTISREQCLQLNRLAELIASS